MLPLSTIILFLIHNSMFLLPDFPHFFSMRKPYFLNSIMDFLEENNLFNSKQSGFRSNDSCENQLLSIVHDIYSSFDCYPSLEVRGIFSGISKAFGRF